MLRKLILFLFIIAVIVGITAYMDKDVRDWILQTSGQAPGKSKVYKWRDSNGVWQISNSPPADGTPYTEQEYLHDTNVVPALPETE